MSLPGLVASVDHGPWIDHISAWLPPPARKIILEQIPGRSAHCCQTHNQSPGEFFPSEETSNFCSCAQNPRVRAEGGPGLSWSWCSVWRGECECGVMARVRGGLLRCYTMEITLVPPHQRCTGCPRTLSRLSSNTTSTFSWQMQDTNNIFRHCTSAYLVVTKVRCVML